MALVPAILRRLANFIRIRMESTLRAPVFQLAARVRRAGKARFMGLGCTKAPAAEFGSPDLSPDSRGTARADSSCPNRIPGARACDGLVS